MKRLLSRIAFELAVRFAQERLANVASGGYRIGYQQARRDSLRGLFPKATDQQLDAVLARQRRNN